MEDVKSLFKEFDSENSLQRNFVKEFIENLETTEKWRAKDIEYALGHIAVGNRAKAAVKQSFNEDPEKRLDLSKTKFRSAKGASRVAHMEDKDAEKNMRDAAEKCYFHKTGECKAGGCEQFISDMKVDHKARKNATKNFAKMKETGLIDGYMIDCEDAKDYPSRLKKAIKAEKNRQDG